MANPPGSILHCRYLLRDNSDRSLTFSFGWTWQCWDGTSLQSPSGSDLTNLSTALVAFMNTTLGGATNPISDYIGPSASRATNASEVVMYDIANALGRGELAGSPYSVVPFTLGPAGQTSNLPEQVCQTLAWRANYGPDPEFGTHLRPRADDRNRMYIGPLILATTTMDAESPGRVEFTTGFLSDCYKAFSTTYSTLLPPEYTGNAWELVAWSRKLAAVKPATEFSQNLYPTTQRRRIDKRPLLAWTQLLA